VENIPQALPDDMIVYISCLVGICYVMPRFPEKLFCFVVIDLLRHAVSRRTAKVGEDVG